MDTRRQRGTLGRLVRQAYGGDLSSAAVLTDAIALVDTVPLTRADAQAVLRAFLTIAERAQDMERARLRSEFEAICAGALEIGGMAVGDAELVH